MKFAKLIFLVALAAITFTVPINVHASVGVTVTPGSQVANQGGQATYTINLGFSDLTPGNTFILNLSGLPSSASYSFSPSTGGVGLGVNSQLIINLSQSGGSGPGGLYCPGTYSFTVTATENDVNGTMVDSGSGSGSLNVVQVGPPLTVTLTTDKPTYIIGDTVNIQMGANRPGAATLSITPPSGPPAVFNYVFAGPTYTLARSFAAQVTGRYIVNLQANDFCSGSSSAVAYFDVSPNTYQISISFSGLPPQISAGLTVDGQGSGTIGGSEIKSLSFPISSTHTVTVDQYVPGENPGTRYFAAQNSLTVTSSGSYTFNYQGQYMFTVGTNPNGITQVSGGGWFNAGSTVQTGTAASTLPGSSGTQYAFQSWQLDGVAQTGNPISVTLDKPHSAIATYQTQYQLTIISPYGNPQGAGWYATGSTATFSVSSPSGILIQQTFVQWQGDYVGTSAQGTILMDGPKSAQATWTTSYTQLYIALGAIALIAVAVFLIQKRRSGGDQTTTKPTPPTPPQTGTTTRPPDEGAGPVNCPSCGAENAAGDAFCINCGTSLTDKQPLTVSEVPVSSRSDESSSGFH